ncbi:RICIN domain-containing protein [Brevundimonas staleyi]|uniref:RICIN domain-containing protein n=1 Tax=Brevundimonas staleyi TaxID=74326 RepID=A0ABW0FLF5_9CAUL
MIRALLIGLCLAASILPSAVAAQEYSSSDRRFYGGDYRIVSRMNGLCLNVSGGRIYEGAVLITWDCVDAPNERFRAQRAGDNGWMRLTIQGPDGLYCVQLPSWQGQQMRLAKCGGGDQTFRFNARSPFAIETLFDQCLNIEGQRRERGIKVIRWPCSGEVNEAWAFERAY